MQVEQHSHCFLQCVAIRFAMYFAMYIESVPKKNRLSPPAVLLRESDRRGAEPGAHFGHLAYWPPKLVERLRTLLNGGPAPAQGTAGQLTPLRSTALTITHRGFTAEDPLVQRIEHAEQRNSGGRLSLPCGSVTSRHELCNPHDWIDPGSR
jgi:hypothetical protein